MLDYDGCRHNLETVQSTSKKREDIKVAKSREQLEEARRLYEVLNKELHEELPALYDSRIPFFVNTFQTLFSSEAQFHQEYSKVYFQLSELIELLATEAAKGAYQTDANRYFSQSSHVKSNLDNNQHNAVVPSPLQNLPESPTLKPSYEESIEQIESSEAKIINAAPTVIQRVSQSNGDHGNTDDTSPVVI